MENSQHVRDIHIVNLLKRLLKKKLLKQELFVLFVGKEKLLKELAQEVDQKELHSTHVIVIQNVKQRIQVYL